jgi:hypothetical protein
MIIRNMEIYIISDQREILILALTRSHLYYYLSTFLLYQGLRVKPEIKTIKNLKMSPLHVLSYLAGQAILWVRRSDSLFDTETWFCPRTTHLGPQST